MYQLITFVWMDSRECCDMFAASLNADSGTNGTVTVTICGILTHLVFSHVNCFVGSFTVYSLANLREFLTILVS